MPSDLAMSPGEPPRTALDSTVLVAGFLPWHEDHAAARGALVELLAPAPEKCFLPVPALVESYSVLTRLPAPHRLSPAAAHELLASALRGKVALVGFSSEQAWPFLAAQREAGIAGGAVYDAIILACAVAAGAGRLVTCNRRRFERLASAEIEIHVPGAPRERG